MDDKEHIKVVFLGENYVGKTSLINKYINNIFEENTPSHNSASYVLKIINYNSKNYYFDIWDTCGYEKFRTLNKFFIEEAKIIVLVYDITKKSSFLELDYWLETILKELGPNAFLILVGNKIDLFENEEISQRDGEKFAEILKAKFILSSAKDDNWSKNFEDALIDYIKTLNQ